MIEKLKYAIFCLLISSCGNTKYSYEYERGKHLDFSKGLWILNKPYSNKNINHLYDIAYNSFGVFLKDSLKEIDDLREYSLIKNTLPYNPNHRELRDLQIGTNCDFLINYRVTIMEEDMGSFTSPPPLGTVIDINQAKVEILIYDLNTLEIISQSAIIGKAEIEINAEESGWEYVQTASTISKKALAKLIKRYEKNKINN